MNNPVATLRQRLAASSRRYQPMGTIGETRAHLRFIGTFEGREVVWDARVYVLRGPRAVATRPFLDIAATGRHVVGIRIGLAVARLDEAVLLKTIIMVRQYKRLRRGRYEFGEAATAPTQTTGRASRASESARGPRLGNRSRRCPTSCVHAVVDPIGETAGAPFRGIGKIISGGQTGVDRAALDAAMELGIPCGGWCPKGRRAEDGIIPVHYPLTETTSKDYRVRTRRNVHDADGTLILAAPPLRGGSALTRRIAAQLGKPCLAVDPAKTENLARARDWIVNHHVTVLNVAGPRESGQPGVHRQSRQFLRRLLRAR